MLSLMKRKPTCFFLNCWNHAEPSLSDPLESDAEYVESCPDLLLCVPQEIVRLIEGCLALRRELRLIPRVCHGPANIIMHELGNALGTRREPECVMRSAEKNMSLLQYIVL